VPVEVDVQGQGEGDSMATGRGTLTLPSPTSLFTVDPESKILRQNDAIDRYRDDQAKAKPKSAS